MNSAANILGFNPTEYSTTILATGKFGILIFLLFSFIYSYGAAKLSYNYNMSMNNGSLVYFWCLLCFFFSSIYYPYYAFFLNPVLPVSVALIGGKRQKN